MTYPVTVYRWDDPGAPQLPSNGTFGTTNELKEVLKKCLVEGYGSKAGQGWSVVFDDSNGFVLQNNVGAGGSGGMVRLWPGPGRSFTTNLSPSSNSSAYLQSAKMYTASDAPFKPSHPVMICHPANPSLASGTSRAWVIIATPIGFYMELAPYHPTSNSAEFFMSGEIRYIVYCGDLISNIPSDDYRFVCFGRGWGSTSLTEIFTINVQLTTYSLDESSDTLTSPINTGFLMYDGDGGSGNALYRMSRALIRTQTNGYTTTGQYDMICFIPVFVTRNDIQGAAPSNDVQSNKLPLIRGYIPGLFTAFIGDGGSFTRWPYFRVIDGKNHYLIRTRFGMSVTWVNTVEW